MARNGSVAIHLSGIGKSRALGEWWVRRWRSFGISKNGLGAGRRWA